MEFREAVTQQDWAKVYQLLIELRTDLSREGYKSLLKDMKSEGYRVFCLYDEEELVSLAGVIIRTNFYSKRHVFVYDLVTASSVRSKGYGRKLLQFVEEWGKGEGCETIGLDSGLQRKDAHRFYEVMEFSKSSYAFRKNLF
ncbi:GNAT family N-acetyltransferase [Bacillus salacetis]|uniref:GNAT family N-acetyltransferase n=1 Tax=Bacillus salacetis TaxID=2315464 RepID=A0A3A1R0L5_9BACI|nr:GNAT family N-acetyltransferase [Bacillus salacetis]RIW35074.1 GNAT family N-acetyltransferase [Bacillus salacetis]